MKDLRIIFMGTPDFAVASLKTLLKNDYNIVGVITAPDKPAGRGRKLNQSAVKKFAVQHNLNVLQPTNLKDPSFLKTLENLQADLQIIVAFRMLPKEVWSMPKYGTFNLHASLLPEYRGAAPINWAIINGETRTGVTTFFLDEKIDTGEIILQKEIEISPTENAGELHDKLMETGSKLVLETTELIADNKISTIPQPKKDLKSAPKLNKENCRIDWSDSLTNIYNMIRGLSPYPASWSIINNDGEEIDVKIYQAEKVVKEHNFEPGKIITDKKELKVAVAKGFIKITSLKISGKRKMDTISFLNGFNFSEKASMS
ncbi:MAG: methionyl-tRNA formyltransferase [Bacteroidota bacterium]